MKIAIYSDIHLEFGDLSLQQPECDVVILSGDIGVGTKGVEWAKNTFACPVIYVAGNHEHYGHNLLANHDALMAASLESNVAFLQNSSIEIEGVRFIGATLWTDFALYGNPHLHSFGAQNELQDFKSIRTDRGVLRSSDVMFENAVSKQYMNEELSRPFDGKTVVVTHHAPSELSVAEQYLGDNLTPAFAGRMENFILANNPVLWTHGHLHNSSDYWIGDTRVICNPRGYAGHSLNGHFDPNLVITI